MKTKYIVYRGDNNTAVAVKSRRDDALSWCVQQSISLGVQTFVQRSDGKYVCRCFPTWLLEFTKAA